MCEPGSSAAHVLGAAVDALLALATQADLAALFARDESMLVDALGGLSFADGRRFLRYWISAAEDEIDKPPAGSRHANRHLHVNVTFGGDIDIRGLLDAVGGA